MTRQLKCRTCGDFVAAVRVDDELVPVGNSGCPDCGSTDLEEVTIHGHGEAR